MKPWFEEAKKHTKKLSDILKAGDVTNMGTMVYWQIVKENWEKLRDVMDGPRDGKPADVEGSGGKGIDLRDAAILINILFDEVEYDHENVLPPAKPTVPQKEALRRLWEEVKANEKEGSR